MVLDEVATNEVLPDPIHSLKCNGLPSACNLVAHAPLFFFSSFQFLSLLIHLLIVALFYFYLLANNMKTYFR
jgi:hypothetical protein